MPTVRAGREDHRRVCGVGHRRRALGDRGGRRARQASSRAASASSFSARMAAASSAALIGARLADRQRADRHAAGHLHDGKKRVLPRQRLGFDGHAENRQRRHRRRHARQMRRATRPGDDDLEPGLARALGEGRQPVGGAMGGDDARIEPMPSASRVCAAWRMVDQSDWLPMMMATGLFWFDTEIGSRQREGVVLQRRAPAEKRNPPVCGKCATR